MGTMMLTVSSLRPPKTVHITEKVVRSRTTFCFIRLTEHTMDKLCFKYVWKQDAET